MSKTVLITGVCGGIGRATAERFMAQGWRVAGTDAHEAAGDLPEGVGYHATDLSREEDIVGLKQFVERECGRLDALVNNAAMQVCKPLVQTTCAEWDQVMDTNLRAVFLAMKYFHPLLAKARGAVVNVSSVHARQTSRDIAAYAASKGGVLALTRAAALEFASDGIRVNAVLPGATDTAMLREGLGRGHVSQTSSMEERLAQMAARHPLGRIGRPADVAAAIYFLADGEQSGFITGEGLTVDGGVLARLSSE